jgi:hypothetical protein
MLLSGVEQQLPGVAQEMLGAAAGQDELVRAGCELLVLQLGVAQRHAVIHTQQMIGQQRNGLADGWLQEQHDAAKRLSFLLAHRPVTCVLASCFCLAPRCTLR